MTGTTTATNPSYKWQKSIDNVNYTTIAGATASSYSPGSLLMLNTWYRRIVISGTQSSTSASVKISVVSVDTTKASGTLASTSAVRSTNSANFYRRSNENNPLLKLVVTNNGYTDETVIRLMNEATEKFDGNYDASKRMNEGSNPSLYSEIKGISYAINSLNELENEDELEIPLTLLVNEIGHCQFSAKEIKNFDPSYSIVLEDKLLNVSQDLNQNPHYAFDAKTKQNVGRFILRIKRTAITTSINKSEAEQAVKITLQGTMLYVRSFDANASDPSIYIFSPAGSEVGKLENIQFTSGEFKQDMAGYPPGVYIIKVLVNKKAYVQKILLP